MTQDKVDQQRLPSGEVARFGRRMGMKLSLRHPVLAAKRLLLPVEYIRCIEFQYVLDHLEVTPSSRVLDLGSPKMLGMYLGDHAQEVILSDYDDYFLERARQEIAVTRARDRFTLETQDARSITYGDDTMDRVFSVSVFEHIDDDGDSVAMREVARVLKPGGLFSITVPHDDGGYREEFTSAADPSAYWVKGSGSEKVFYQRIYDHPTLHARLVDASPDLELLDLTYFGETEYAAEHELFNQPRWLKLTRFPFHPRYARKYCVPVEHDTPTHKKVACMTFRKKG